MDNLVNSRIAVIPARGGSKRLPNKNIMDFFGKPMIAWTIEAALDSELFDSVLVSTDSDEIAKISRRYGAEVPFLREEKYDDYSTVSEATIAALSQLKHYNGKDYKTVVQLMANCPVRSAQNIIQQVAFFEGQENKRSVLSGFKYGMFNPWWAHKKNEEGIYVKVLDQFASNIRSQDLPELICPSGATWISTKENLLNFSSFYSTHYTFYEMEWQEAVDIDDNFDLRLAIAAYMLKNETI